MVSQEIVLPPRQASYASEGDQDRRGQLADQKTIAKSEYRRHVGSFRCVKVSGTTFLCEPQALRNLCQRISQTRISMASRSCEDRAGNAIQTLRLESESAAEFNKRNHRALVRALQRRTRMSAATYESLPETHLTIVQAGYYEYSICIVGKKNRRSVIYGGRLYSESVMKSAPPQAKRSVLHCIW